MSKILQMNVMSDSMRMNAQITTSDRKEVKQLRIYIKLRCNIGKLRIYMELGCNIRKILSVIETV